MRPLPYLAAGLLVLAQACTDESAHVDHDLPIIGEREVDAATGDTLYHTVGDWAFYRQDSALVTEDMLAGTPYVVDFFFTSCPTICPRVTSNMLRVHARFVDSLRTPLKLVSFTVDPRRDSVGHLRRYASNLGLEDAERWWFLTGDKLALYDIADDYFSVALENPDAPGGFDHSGRILFVDEQGRVRAYANGTDEAEVDHLMLDIEAYVKARYPETFAGADPDARG